MLPVGCRIGNMAPWLRSRDGLQVLLAVIPGPKCKNIDVIMKFILKLIQKVNDDEEFKVFDHYR
jgi:hypothetical protein